jgi:hypothetical protein
MWKPEYNISKRAKYHTDPDYLARAVLYVASEGQVVDLV